MADDVVASIIEDLEEVSDRPLTPDDVQALKDAVFAEPEAFEAVLTSEQSYFVIGSYNTEEERRLLLVKQILANRRAGDHAFLMKDLPAFTRNFALKFHVLIRRTDYVVGVFEHNRGGHEWEAGALSSPPVRHRTWILKRDYPTTEAEHEAFDAMIADFFGLVDEFGQLLLWTDEAELEELAENEIP